MRADISKHQCLYLSSQMDEVLFKKSYTLSDIDKAAIQFWETLSAYRIFAFSGDLGAGKTTFIHHLCDYLLVEDTVSSPTFALINEYHFREGSNDSTIYHLDWYRLKDSAEAVNAGMEDCLLEAEGGRARCFVEWPEKARELLRKPYLWISIASKSAAEREMTVTLMK